MCYLFFYILVTAAIIKITTFNVRQPSVKVITLDMLNTRGDIAIMQLDLPENHTVIWGKYKKNTGGYDIMHYISTVGSIPAPFVKPDLDWEPQITVLSY